MAVSRAAEAPFVIGIITETFPPKKGRNYRDLYYTTPVK